MLRGQSAGHLRIYAFALLRTVCDVKASWCSGDELRDDGPYGEDHIADAMRLRSEHEHVFVLGASVVDVRELGEKHGEVHGSSFNSIQTVKAGAWRTACRFQRTRTEPGSGRVEGTHAAFVRQGE
jgi:hypothetical protein